MTVRSLLALALVAACSGAPTAAPPTGTSASPTLSATPATTPAPTPSGEASPTASGTPAGSASPSAPPTGLPTELAWRPLEVPNGPGPREDHTWTVDPIRHVAYLFGGRANGQALDDLWRYDLATDSWTLLDTPQPRPDARFGHVAAWDDDIGLTIWSGQQSDKFFDDLWIYDPDFNAWQELPGTGDLPPARYGSCGGFAADGFLWITHGFTMEGGRFFDTRAYDLARGRWFDRTPASVPVERCLHDCFWTATGQLVLYAGQTNGVPALGDLWTFDRLAGEWTEQPDPPAPARQLYALAVNGGSAFVFGGGDIDNGYLGDLWRLDVEGLAWTELNPAGTGPAARAGATLIADPLGSRMLLFGGKNDEGEFGDIWQLGAGGG